jgi:hypothetical protein
MIGIVGWVVVGGLLLTWEGLAIAFDRPDWPSTSDMVRAMTRPVVGRWLLFAAWLWLGWHLFMRGWSFFLAGSGARTPPRAPKSVRALLTQVVLPLLTCYAGWLALVAGGRRERLRVRRAHGARSFGPAWSTRGWVRYLATTVTGGYLAFVAVIAGYAMVSGRPGGGVFRGALRDGAFLAFAVALPVFLVAGVVQQWRRARRRVQGSST